MPFREAARSANTVQTLDKNAGSAVFVASGIPIRNARDGKMSLAKN